MYYKNMEQINSDMLEQVLNLTKGYDYNIYTENDVQKTLNKEILDIEDLKILLSPAATDFLNLIAHKAQYETRKHFGSSISLFTPLYISNYCENQCTYCGYNCKNNIHRGKLTIEEIEKEFKAISQTGLEDILILTGESRTASSVEYIGEAVKLAKKYFSSISIEIYPLNTDEYKYLCQCGADFVCVYQETYNKDRYKQLHLAGPKSVFEYRFYAQERAALAGMRGVSLGILFGLDDFRKDAFSTAVHAYLLQQKYPDLKIGFSVPRLRPYIHEHKEQNPHYVNEKQLFQALCAYRLFMPFSDITISTRERAGFRDNVIGVCATKISAGVKTSVGGHKDDAKGDEQFEISDSRTVAEIVDTIKQKGLYPVFSNHIRL
ncbi:2-iminoacetate synthase ThiH [Candidatus Ruminimicrobiellum ovillum]|uniref:2-iminoacetate synthase ThiH n=1 Tax=Candidatus Ruminimicrobiellum ovillum TaxID=1947927 RepID=UPI0035594762